MLIVKSKYLISSAEDIYIDHSLVVRGENILEILPNSEVEMKYPKAKIIDKTNSILMPGFINAHMHQYGVLSRGIPANVEFKDFEGFLWDYWWPFIENRIGLKEVKATTKASAIELIKSGVIGFCDTLEAPNTEEGTLIEQGKILEDIGMKAVLSLESCERISYENGVKCLDENSRLIEWSRKKSKLIRGIICTHTTFTCSDKFLKLAQNKAKELKAPWQFHLSESIYEVDHCLKNYGKLPVKYLEHLGLLDKDVLASQCVKVKEEEIKILKERDVKVVHMPLSNCEVGGGFAPIPDLLDAGVEVALGTDGYINDFFAVMKSAFLLHKAVKEDASVMSASIVFKMATEYGAKALGWKNTGKLVSGNKADFIIMENNFKTPVTLDNIFDQIVVQGEKEFIDSVYINGRPILEDGELKTIDKKQISKEMKNVAEEFWKF
ncbi:MULTISPECIES: amidohydrolase family protein [Schnuerera]|uniref:Amidohydrolase family protein n=1 Tax=[Clostridium] ultunense Esp TaxID=1288971 RepID=A0A1M4PLN1_9FIRM|nr:MULTISPECIES: amidohydrolase family protein [Schnuerera]SHD76359.1 Amidohydrolase family protein [[Clostridium] ultunense Esp]HSH36992.1 amidohydrolase family protein [Schnuerera sp.]